MSNKASFIHLGGDVSIYCSELIGVFDLERTTVNPAVNRFLAAAQKRGGVYYCAADLEAMPKSFAVTNDTVFVTNVGVGTVRGRFVGNGS
ncbi:MAG: DUF370 domain-containing protein [Oscillospiraceae bacterium]|nr:DUF370 domain-containing protein [Oscillospiraceae bacterium]